MQKFVETSRTYSIDRLSTAPIACHRNIAFQQRRSQKTWKCLKNLACQHNIDRMLTTLNTADREKITAHSSITRCFRLKPPLHCLVRGSSRGLETSHANKHRSRANNLGSVEQEQFQSLTWSKMFSIAAVQQDTSDRSDRSSVSCEGPGVSTNLACQYRQRGKREHSHPPSIRQDTSASSHRFHVLVRGPSRFNNTECAPTTSRALRRNSACRHRSGANNLTCGNLGKAGPEQLTHSHTVKMFLLEATSPIVGVEGPNNTCQQTSATRNKSDSPTDATKIDFCLKGPLHLLDGGSTA